MVVLIAMNGNNHIHSKQAHTFVYNGLDMITNYTIEMKWESTVVVLAINTNNHIHSKQELTFGA